MQNIFDQLLNSAPDAIVGINEKGEIVVFNEQACRLFGYELDEILGRPIEMLMPRRYQAVHKSHLRHYFHLPTPRRMGERNKEMYARRKSGAEFPIDIALSHLETEKGTIALASIRDVTDIKRAESELRNREAILEALAECANRLLGSSNFETELDAMFEHLGKAARASRIFLRRKMHTGNDEKECLVSVKDWQADGIPVSMKDGVRGDHIPEFCYEIGELFKGRTLIQGNKDNLPGELNRYFVDYIDSELAIFPIHCQEIWWGCLQIEQSPQDMTWSPAELKALSSAAKLLGAAIDRTIRQERIAQSERLLQQAEEIAGLGSWEFNHQTGNLIWSKETYRIYGVQPGIFKPDYDQYMAMMYPADRAMFLDVFNRAMQEGGAYQIQHRIIAADGRIRHVHCKAETMFDQDGLPQTSVGTIWDISERVHAEQSLKLSEEKFRSMYENNPVGMYRCGLDGVIHECNPSLAKILGLENRDQVIGRKASDLVHNLMDIDFVERLKGLGGVMHGYESCLRLSDFRVVHLLENAFIQRDNQGNTWIEGTLIDITERKVSEMVLLALSLELSVLDLEGSMGNMLPVLAEAIGVECAFVARASGHSPQAIVMSFWKDGEFLEPFTYDLADTPCKRVVGMEPCIFPENVQDLFPMDIDLRRLHAESYAGYPLYFSSGEPVGLVAFLSRQKLVISEHADKMLRLAAKQIAAILEKIESRKAIEVGKKRLEEIIESAQLGTWEWNVQTGEIRFNPLWAEMIGYELSELEPISIETWSKLVHPDDLLTSTALLVEHFDGISEHYTCEARMKHKDGHWIWVKDNGKLMSRTPEGMPEWMYGTHADITARKKAEEDLKGLNANLEDIVAQRTLELESANRQLEAFSYSVSHDLRTPLVAQRFFIESLIKKYGGQLPEGARTMVENIRLSGADMDRLIQGLLTFFGMSKLPSDISEIDLNSTVLQVWEQINSTGGSMTSFKIENLPVVHADESLLRQVLTNLISNALKYSSKAAQPEITVGSFDKSGSHVVFVRDNGVGFDMRHQEKLFRTFQRLHSDEDFEGVGLGLAIVKNIIENHGGEVWAESKPNEGAVFYFSLPKALK